MSIRIAIKRFAPNFVREAYVSARVKLGRPPLEQSVLHGYRLLPDDAPQGRVTLVIHTLATKAIYGGIATGIDFLFNCACAMGMPARIVIDQFNDASDINYVKRIAERYGLNPNSIEIVRRTADTQPVPVRKDDVFVAYNWWAAINLHGLISQQQTYFGLVKRKPMLYIVQDYEPGFYPMSSTHMLARAAFDGNGRTFGIFNSSELHAYFRAQGHAYDREFVIPLRMSKNLKAARRQDVASKGRRILVYGRPRVARNCFPAVVAGLRAFASAYEQFADWSIGFGGSPRHD